MRKPPPAASSVFSISEKAGESQLSSGRPGRFLNPSTATERRARIGTVNPEASAFEDARRGSERKP